MQSAEQAVQYVTYEPQAAACGAQPTVAYAQLHTRGFTHSQQKVMKTLAGIQIAIGISCVIIEAVLISLRRPGGYYLDYVSSGIWCGAFYITAGCLGFAAAWTNRLSLTVSTMIISIINSILVWIVLGIAAAAINGSVTHDLYVKNNRLTTQPTSSCKYYDYFWCTYHDFSGYKAADSILVVMSLAEFVVSIWTAMLCSQAYCRPGIRGYCDGCDCTSQTPAMYIGTAQAGGGPQFIVLPQSHVPGGQTIGMISSQHGYPVGPQHVMFASPACAPVYGQPGMSRPINYSAAPADASTACRSGDSTKEQMAA